MIVGIGVDLVQISEISRLISLDEVAFISHTFTENEIAESANAPEKARYFSSRFAAKEAAFKAIAHHAENQTFDLRIVETLKDSDGCPSISMNGELGALLRNAGINALFVSLSTDGDHAIAVVVAEK